jgi:hypothetical protein
MLQERLPVVAADPHEGDGGLVELLDQLVQVASPPARALALPCPRLEGLVAARQVRGLVADEVTV